MKNKNGRSERIEFIRKKLGYTVKGFATRIGIAPDAVKKSLSGKSEPSLKTMDAIVDALPVSLNWLTSEEGKPFTQASLKEYMASSVDLNGHKAEVDKGIATRFLEIREADLGYTQAKFAAELGVTRDVVSCIDTGKTSPTIYLVIKISDLYGYNLDWICKGIGPKKDKK